MDSSLLLPDMILVNRSVEDAISMIQILNS